MGYNRINGRGYTSASAGVSGVTSDGTTVTVSADLLLGLDQQILCNPSNQQSKPHICDESDRDVGHRYSANIQAIHSGGVKADVRASQQTNNDSFVNINEQTYTPTTPQQIDLAGDTITSTRAVNLLINDTASSITLTSTPTITAGANGETLRVVNVGADNIVIQDDAALANSDVFLRGGAASITLATGQGASFIYNTTVPGWTEL